MNKVIKELMIEVYGPINAYYMQKNRCCVYLIKQERKKQLEILNDNILVFYNTEIYECIKETLIEEYKNNLKQTVIKICDENRQSNIVSIGIGLLYEDTQESFIKSYIKELMELDYENDFN